MVLPKLGAAGLAGDGVDLGAVAGESAVEGGPEMLGRDGAERRQTEWAGPVGKKRIFGIGVCGHRRAFLSASLAAFRAAYLGFMDLIRQPDS